MVSHNSPTAGYDYAQRTLDELMNVANLPEVKDHTGERYPELMAKMLYVPRENGSISFEETDEIKIPIVTLFPGDEFVIRSEGWSLSPLQRRALAQKLSSWADSSAAGGNNFENHAEYVVNQNRQFLPSKGWKIQHEPRVEAAVVTPTCPISLRGLPKAGKSLFREVVLKPVVTLHARDREQMKSPIITYHEWQHVMQSVFNPVLPAPQTKERFLASYRAELEAYQAELNLGLILRNVGYKALTGDSVSVQYTGPGIGPSLSRAMEINQLRIEANAKRKDKFFPDGKLIKLMDEVGLDIVF
ncbi:MAG TPA: hypothetical protein PK865_00900 [Candidatus Saccharibacteria bacterium]|nr:hypothetical protein [Candidatus Saccharibacteria bacterium]